ncbi:MAG: hypothetical protein LBG43_10195 [Treponema sp.]|jgi:L-cystine transport system ATP-binding protein|nr:hypothetical protein [Treponema sp.]
MSLKPAIILFDEPTSALHLEMAGDALRVIQDMAKEADVLIIASHELSFINEIASHVMFIDDGVILEGGQSAGCFL